MTELAPKPFKLTPASDWGFTAARRPDGGMHIVFNNISPASLRRWREFALAHLEDSDRLTTNLYDLRLIDELPEAAIRYAVEANQDPSTRHIRLAVVVGNAQVAQGVHEVDALSAGYGVEMMVFNSLVEAEAWLSRPLTQLV